MVVFPNVGTERGFGGGGKRREVGVYRGEKEKEMVWREEEEEDGIGGVSRGGVRTLTLFWLHMMLDYIIALMPRYRDRRGCQTWITSAWVRMTGLLYSFLPACRGGTRTWRCAGV